MAPGSLHSAKTTVNLTPPRLPPSSTCHKTASGPISSFRIRPKFKRAPPADKYEFDLQNQDGSRLVLAPADRKALVMGLALHAKGQATLAAATRAARAAAAASGSGSAGAAAPAGGAAEAAAGGGGGAEGGAGAAGGAGAQLRQALEELLMAEEAFDLVGGRRRGRL